MKAHTNRFKEEIGLNGRQLDSIITYKLNGVTQTLTSEQLNGVTPTFQGAILKSVMKQLDVDSNVDIPIGTSINYKFGVLVDGTFEYLNFGNYIVYSSEKQEDLENYKLICYDKLLFSMMDNQDLGVTYPISVRDYLKALCNKLGLQFKNANDNFVNYNRMIQKELYVGQEYTYRDILDELAQVTASTICLNENDELELRYISNNAVDTIDEEYLKDININFGQKNGPVNSIVLSRSGESDNIYLQDEESVQANGLCELKIVDNQIMNWNDRADYLPAILAELDGLEYYINDFVSTGIAYLDLCDRYNVKIGDNTYSCIMLNDELEVTQGLVENIHTDMPEETETDYTKADKTDRKINQTYLIVDKQNQTIKSVVSQTNEQNKKISQIIQSVDEINSKISDIADITTSGESQQASVNLVKVNESEPIAIKIHPLIEDIAYLYPSEFLYPSEDLYPMNRVIRFTNTKTNEIFDYELPNDLLVYNVNNYDEFILNYDSQTCQVVKRVGYDKTTNKNTLLPKEEIINYKYPTISLTEGDYTISLPGYSSGYLYVQLMASNIYTTQFATKVELSSSISQTKEEINLEVSKKVGKNEVISSINLTSEAATIQASKVNISGVISAINNNTSTTINGDKITTGSITASQIKTGTITADKVSSDIITTSNFLAQNINADKITSGTIDASKIAVKNLNADNITAGTLSTSRLSSDVITTNNFNAQSINADNITSGTISGRKISGGSINGASIKGGSIKIGDRETTIASNGEVSIYPNTGGVYRFADGAVRFNANKGAVIASSSNGSVYAGSGNLDLKACGGHDAYLGCMLNANGTTQRSSVTCQDGVLKFYSAGYCTYNGSTVFGSSSKATKENIKPLTQKQKEEVYELIKQIPTKQYDYKKQYGKPFNYGFIIEDIEDTKLKDLLHITQNEENKDIKMYSTEDLVRLQLITIQELMKKIDKLQERVSFLEKQKI